MRLQSFKIIASLLVAAAITVGCGGGSPAPAPTGLKAVATESTITVSWDATPGVEYWLFYAPTIYAPTDNSVMSRWFNLLGGNVLLNVSSPHVLTGLADGNSYSFTVNGRTGGGPGGPGATTLTATPRIAGGIWSANAAASAQTLRALNYNGTYLAAGTGGAILSSPDAITWTAQSSTTNSTLNGLGYHLTNYIAVGDGGTLLTSADGLTWAAKTSSTTRNLNAVATNGALAVAVGAGGTIVTSADSSTWTAATSSGTDNDLHAIHYVGATWYAAGANGTLVKSTDGLTWTAIATGSTADLRGIAYGYTGTSTTAATYSFVLVGTGGTVLTSTDAVTWTPQVLPGAGPLNAVTYGTQFIAVGHGGQIFTSTDAVTWTPAALAGMTSDLLAVARGSLMYAAVGAAGTNLTSK